MENLPCVMCRAEKLPADKAFVGGLVFAKLCEQNDRARRQLVQGLCQRHGRYVTSAMKEQNLALVLLANLTGFGAEAAGSKP